MIWLDNARIVAIFAVVLLHVAASVLTQSEVGSENWWIGNLYDSFVRWCVPLFLMISGALLLDPKKDENLKSFYLKRASRIFVPTVFWSFFFIIFSNINTILSSGPLVIFDLLQGILSGKPHYHLWFLYMIITLYLFTPFFRKIIAGISINELVVLVVLTSLLSFFNSFLGIFSDNSKIFLNWFISYLPYFFLGYLIRVTERVYSSRLLCAIFIFSFAVTAIGYYVNNTKAASESIYDFYHYVSVSVFFMSVSIIYLLKLFTSPIISIEFTKQLSALTLGVYLIHPIFISLVKHAGFGPLAFYTGISIPIVTFVVFCLSVTAAWVINKIPYLKRVI